MSCPKCDTDLNSLERDHPHPWGDPIPCPKCGVLLETDWDQIDYDSAPWWFTGRITKNDI